jgi:hypothetical protein
VSSNGALCKSGRRVGENKEETVKKCIVLVISFVAMATYAQAPDTLWTRTYGGAENDGASSILQTSDGGYIIAGYTESFGAGEKDVWILRLDSSGGILWTKTYGQAWPDESAASIQHTTDGGYIVVGTRYSGGPVDSIWLLKTDEDGDTLWTKSFSRSRGLWASDCIQTSDGGYLITGGGWTTIFAMKTDSLGESLWCNSYGWGASPCGKALQETPDSNYIIAGILGVGASGAANAFGLMKVGPQGTMLWSQAYYDPGESECNDVLVTGDGCLTGCGGWGEGDYDICLIRTDANGDTLWTKFFCEGIAYSLDRTFDGGYIMVGETSEDAVWIRTDSLGDTLWTAVYGGPGYDCLYSVLQTSDGGYIAVGETSSFGAGNADVWIVKLGPDVGVAENKNIIFDNESLTATIFRGPLQLPKNEECKVYDITGRVVEPSKIQPGIYFIEVDGVVTQKVVKVR